MILGKINKEIAKDRKEAFKELKEQSKERKDIKDRVEGKQIAKDVRDTGGGKGTKELAERPGGLGAGESGGLGTAEVSERDALFYTLTDLDARVAALEAAASGPTGGAEPFISGDLRPDLVGSVDYAGQGDLQQRMAAGDRDAKRAFDTLPS